MTSPQNSLQNPLQPPSPPKHHPAQPPHHHTQPRPQFYLSSNLQIPPPIANTSYTIPDPDPLFPHNFTEPPLIPNGAMPVRKCVRHRRDVDVGVPVEAGFGDSDIVEGNPVGPVMNEKEF